MPNITVLSEDLINKIAAGEVIERPASVVKELLENALDAGASKVMIEIKDSGKELIRVTDNGEGMDEIDAKNAILRHATSKLRTEEDLMAIATLGFRGEALSSIAAVSRFSLVTKQEEQIEGFHLLVEGGKITGSGIMAAEQGTTIEVKDLFFNTPARKKFLKSDQVELRHIIEIATYYALLNPAIDIQLVHDGRRLLHAPAPATWRNNIAAIYGTKLAKELLEVNYKEGPVSVYGFISTPYAVRNDKQQQILFVNQRWVRNETLTKAIYEAYHSMLFVQKHPIFFLHLQLDPHTIDVNVHPQKSEIKIEQKEEVASILRQAILKTLQENNLIPTVDLSFEQQMNLGSTVVKEFSSKETKESKYVLEPSSQQVLHVKEQEKIKEELLSQEKFSVRNSLPPLKLLGQVHKTYFVAETVGGVFYIDQHAAHERVLYERFMAQYMEHEVAVQRLLQGEILEFSAVDILFISEHLEILRQFGFTLEPFGDNNYVLTTIPLLFERLQPKEIIFEVVAMLKEQREKIAEAKEEIVTRMACRAAVMAGDELTLGEMEKILKELSETALPYTCPHGRPTLLKVTVNELERKFRRRG